MSEETDTNKRARPFLLDVDAAWVPVGKLVGAVAFIVAASLWADRMQRTLDQIVRRVDSMDGHIRKMPDSADFKSWVNVLRAANPQLVVPPFEPRNGG